MAPRQTGIRSTPTAAGASGARAGRGRWPHAGPDQFPLLLASLAMLVGSFLPWVLVGGVALGGMKGAGLWTLYGASLGVAGSLVRRPLLAAVSAAAAGALGVALPVWQVVHVLGKAGVEGWRPGLGLVVVFLGGVIALRSAWRLGNVGNHLRTAGGVG